MTDKFEEGEDFDSDSGDSFIDDADSDEPTTSGQDDGLHLESPPTEEEIEDLIAELLEVESKAAEAQESLEDESLARVEVEVREELAQSLKGDDLEKAVKEEMEGLKEEWETVLDDLETESAHLLEQLDCAGIELPSLYKWIESQAPNGCCTEAWKNRTHWVGSHVTSDVTESVADAEKYLQTHRPVRRRHGKILEEGASGFLGKRLATVDGKEALTGNSDVDWCSFNKMFASSADSTSFGSKNWASVYLASTPQQAAELGLKFPGVDEVEEIDDIDGSLSDPFIADAVVNEQELNLSEEQRRNFKKVREEDDVNLDRKLQLHLKRKRQRKRLKQEGIIKEDFSGDMLMDINLDQSTPIESISLENDIALQTLRNGEQEHIKSGIDMQNQRSDDTCSMFSGNASRDITKSRVSKRPLDSDELCANSKKIRVVTIDSDDDIADARSGIASDAFDQCDLQGNGGNNVAANDPSDSLNMDIRCTACDEVATQMHRHPLLEVVVCGNCKRLLESKMQVKDLECSECYCGWCGGNSELISCRSCKVLFCTSCLKRNLGEKCLLEVQASGWRCCCCNPCILQQLSSQLEKALMSSSESDSDDSDEDANVVISTKRRRKKKIRRILDDAELGEETKRKIAIEKERQDRLKSLEAKFSTKSTMSSAGFIRTLPEGDTIDVLGDALTGYIVNVVREEGEEAVRIPPSISTKLKAHQIAGIRFMWENIIQSISTAKSGDKGLGCILAHTMGLGKTLQVITFLYAAMRSVDLGLKTAIIVMPVNVLHNWRHEFLKWRPSELKPLRVFMLEDVPRDRRADLLMKWRSKGGVFLISYTAFRNLSLGKHVKEKDRHMAKEICNALQDGPDILVCDEAHMIKNTRADTTRALKHVKSQRRIALTGSPLQNNLMEYYCMVDFVREGFLGSSQEFRNRFQNPIENGQHTNSTSDDVKIMNQRSHILYQQLKGFVQRMDMNVVKKDLPPKTVFVIAVKLSQLQRKLYRRFLDVHGFTNDKVSNEKIRKSFFAGYQALAQIWNHPRILQLMNEDKDFTKREDAVENCLADDSSSDDNMDNTMVNGEKLRNKTDIPSKKHENGFFRENWWNDLLQENNFEAENSGKMVLLLDILSMCNDVGDKALVFSQSICTLDLIELYLSKLPRSGKTRKCWKQGKDWYRLDGRTAGSERQRLVEKFNNPSNKRVKCTLISTRAGSLGINLYAANRVIIVDGSWNPTYDLQAIYRVWRYGQKKQVFAYRLMAHGTMEEKIYKRQVTKESLSARVVDRQQVHRTISKEEMLHLFDFGDDEIPDTLSQPDQQNGHITGANIADDIGNCSKQKLPLPHGTFSSDKLMESLLGRHYPRWIANYHEHETLLQENEDEKLSKEEQDMAWEVYRKNLEWEESHGVPFNESAPDRKPMQQAPLHASSLEQKLEVSDVAVPEPKPESKPLRHSKGGSRNHSMQRKCTNISHVLTLRSQGTKIGCSTICGECAQEISWEKLNK